MYAVAANSFFVYLLPKANIPMKTIVDVNWSLMKKYNKLEAGIS